ncbi:MAG: ATP-dependent RNA helicase HrpA [Desulfobacterales bacterium]|nr:ATP-dependent RNA helicase HrpA [Desulfobacterales bacterium]
MTQQKSRRPERPPNLTFHDDLPITAKKEQIIDGILQNRVLIISGETGSGKTTQIPKFCLAAGRGTHGLIGCTQPRRISAVAVAHRIAEELGEEVGASVGYKIRFKEKTRQNSFIKILTDGMLLAETRSDPDLYAYDTLIVDEAHERSLNIDFLLGILRKLVWKRKDLKLIITSATMDTEKFSQAFDHAPVIEVSGRMFPVEVRYAPDPDPDQAPDQAREEKTHIDMALSAVDLLQGKSPYGDILIFMPTEQDIRETCDLLAARRFLQVVILPLYARLSGREQSRIFKPAAGRKIVVATNVAETSLTIPGIKYVIDTGLARISQYVPGSRTTCLPVVPISRSSADQRKGRCGRVENGVCIRLYSEEDYLSRPLFTPPEISRANLAEVLLRMMALKLEDIAVFPFIDRPSSRRIKDGFDLLLELGAIKAGTGRRPGDATAARTLTDNGKRMAAMPIDPRLSRMLIQACREGCAAEAGIIAAALSIQDPRERPAAKGPEADRARSLFADPSSDFMTLINIWHKYQEIFKNEPGAGSLKRFCRAHFLSFRRMREWMDIHAQIMDIVKAPPTAPGPQTAANRYEAIHKSVLSGFLSNIGLKKEKNMYTAARGKEMMLFPGSGLFNRAGQWIVCAERVETTRLFARTVANIDSRWLETVGREHCKHTYLHPHWSRSRQEVVAQEQVSLYGLILVDRRPVSYGPINPAHATDIFIQSALVDQDVKILLPFMKHNQSLIDEIGRMEDRLRRRDIFAGPGQIFQFYQARLDNVYDTATLQQRVKAAGSDLFLRMQKEDLYRFAPDERQLSGFPEQVPLGSQRFPCAYRFAPGSPDDGVTVTIPWAARSVIAPDAVDWVVPGLLAEKITALLRGLAKKYRKELVPLADTVAAFMAEVPGPEKTQGKSLINELTNFVYRKLGISIPAAAWPLEALPDHLRMRLRITGLQGEELFSGRDRQVLLQKISSAPAGAELESARRERERTGITQWDFGNLPDAVVLNGETGARWTVYPGLQPEGDTVSLRFFADRQDALASHPRGVAALLALFLAKELKFLKKILKIPGITEDRFAGFGNIRQFENIFFDSFTRTLFCQNIREKEAFEDYAHSMAPGLIAAGQEKLAAALAVVDAVNACRSELQKLKAQNRGNHPAVALLERLQGELSGLAPTNFMALYDTDRLLHVVRYVQALAIRARRALPDMAKDRLREKDLSGYADRLQAIAGSFSPLVSEEKRRAAEAFFWLLQEYKVSLFAQELKTALPVSKKRLDRMLEEIERMT